VARMYGCASFFYFTALISDVARARGRGDESKSYETPRPSALMRRRVATNTAFTELSAALWRQIANISKETGFYARLVRNVGGAKMQGIPCASHIGAGAGSTKGRAQRHAEQRSNQ
jgi:hypothetical protein